MADPLLDDLLDWLRIPSISTGGGKPEDLNRAAEWVLERVDAVGGATSLVTGDGHPIVYGELTASGGRADAPTILIYGPLRRSVGRRSGRVARPAVRARGPRRAHLGTRRLRRQGQLPAAAARRPEPRAPQNCVNVRVLVEGEEEAGSGLVTEWVRADEGPADAAIVFDAFMANERTPAITNGLRGIVQYKVTVRTSRRDLHSGVYGGSVLNAAHVLHPMIARVLPGSDGVLHDELREGIEPPAPAEVESWTRLKPGDKVISEVGGRPLTPDAGARYYERNGADTSLDVNEFVTGEPRTVVPSTARATVAVRLAPGQRSEIIGAALKRMMCEAVPEGAEVDFDGHSGEPALFPVDDPVMHLAAEAVERGTSMMPAFVRVGDRSPSSPSSPARASRRSSAASAYPTTTSTHRTESYRIESLRLGEATSRQLYAAFARLRR